MTPITSPNDFIACARGCSRAGALRARRARPRRHHLDVDRQHAFRRGRPADPRGWLHHAAATGDLPRRRRRTRATHSAARAPDAAAVREVFDAIGGKAAVKLLLTGHSHFDHSFDTATWAKLSGRAHHRLAHHLPAGARSEDSRAALHAGARRREVHARARRRHVCDPLESQRRSGAESRSSTIRVELRDVPVPDASGRTCAPASPRIFRTAAAIAPIYSRSMDRAGRFSWLFQDSASAVDLREPIVVDGKNFGAPLDNLRAAMKAAGARLGRPVDRHGRSRRRGAGAAGAASPRPIYRCIGTGCSAPSRRARRSPMRDAALESLLGGAGSAADRAGAVHGPLAARSRTAFEPLDNAAVKRKLGFH